MKIKIFKIFKNYKNNITRSSRVNLIPFTTLRTIKLPILLHTKRNLQITLRPILANNILINRVFVLIHMLHSVIVVFLALVRSILVQSRDLSVSQTLLTFSIRIVFLAERDNGGLNTVRF